MQPNNRKLLIGILLCGLILRMCAVMWFDPPAFSDDKDYKEIARNVAEGKGYLFEGKPTAYRTPGYPLFIAGMYTLFGYSEYPVRILQVFLDLGSCFLLFLLGKKFFSERVGLLATGILALFPAQILYACQFMTETSFTFLLLLIVWLVASDESTRTTQHTIVIGVFIGLAILIRSTAALLPLIILLVQWKLGYSLRKNLLGLGFITTTALIVISPWLVHNYATFHRISITSNTGVNFWIGNHSGAGGSYSFPKNDNPLEGIGDDYERSDLGMKLGKEFITAHPGEYSMLLAKKFAHFWSADYWLMMTFHPFPDAKDYPNAATLFSKMNPWLLWSIHLPFILILLAGTFGLVCYAARENKIIFILRSVILYWLAVHLAFYAGARYRFPIVPFFILAAAYAWYLWREGNFHCTKTRKTIIVVLTVLFFSGWIAEYITIRIKTVPYPPIPTGSGHSSLSLMGEKRLVTSSVGIFPLLPKSRKRSPPL
jgi:4-amino-4-deoxy-L-arabinose transferase-like glycosyltransferase